MVRTYLDPITHHTYLFKPTRRQSQQDEKNFFYHNIKTLPNIGISRAMLKIICVNNFLNLIIFIIFNNKKTKA